MKLTKLLPLCCVATALMFASCATTDNTETVETTTETTVEATETVPAEEVKTDAVTEEVPAEEVKTEETTETVAE